MQRDNEQQVTAIGLKQDNEGFYFADPFHDWCIERVTDTLGELSNSQPQAETTERTKLVTGEDRWGRPAFAYVADSK